VVKKLVMIFAALVVGGGLFVLLLGVFMSAQGKMEGGPLALFTGPAEKSPDGPEGSQGSEGVTDGTAQAGDSGEPAPAPDVEDLPTPDEEAAALRQQKVKEMETVRKSQESRAYTPDGELRHLSARVFQIPSPFSEEELATLIDELQGGLDQVRNKDQMLSDERDEVARIRLDLDARRQELERSLKAIETLSKEVEADKARLYKTVTVLKSSEETSLKNLAKIYEGMAPQSVSNSLLKMDDAESAKILSRMNPRAAAEALSVMDPERAASLSLMLKNIIRDRDLEREP